MVRRIIVLALVTWLSTICLLPANAGATNHCYHYIYSSDYGANHYSLIQNNSVNIGNDLTVISNCQYSFKHNNSPLVYTQGNQTFTIPMSTDSLTITMDNISYNYNNLTFYPASQITYNTIPPQITDPVSQEELFTNELLTHIVTFAILFFMSTNIVYRFAQRKIDNSIEVVI